MKEKMQHIGKTVLVNFSKIKIEVEIKDYKCSYGRDRWLVSPIAGNGEQWVELSL